MENLVNNVYGYWTVLRKSENRSSDGHVLWWCKCKCGTEREVIGSRLKSGRSQSCGCKSKDTQIKKSLELLPIGTKINNLTILERLDTTPTKYKCQCDCGNIVEVFRTNLKNGSTKSCGCLSKANVIQRNKEDCINMTGWKMKEHNVELSKWTVLKESENNNKTKIKKWICQCECGVIKEISGNDLRSGHSLSCGCLKESKGIQKILYLLDSIKLSYEKEKYFETCKDLKPLPFDIYVNNKYIIEYDGEHHLIPIEKWGGEEELKNTQKHDQMKNQWCKENDIPLIRIPYTHLNQICLDDLLLDKTKFRVT